MGSVKAVAKQLIRRTTGLEIVNPKKYDIVAKARRMIKMDVPSYPIISYARRDSFELAEQEAGIGYVDPILVEGDRSTTLSPDLTLLPDYFGAQIAAFAIVLSQLSGRPLTVMDFGGAHGDLCRIVTSALGLPQNVLNWNVVETDVYVEHAKRNPQPGITFHRTTETLANIDIAVFSGVIHLLKDWQTHLLDPKVSEASFMLTSRTPIGKIEVPFLQTVEYSHGKVRYPGRIMAENEISDALSRTHKRLIAWDLAHHMVSLGIVGAPTVLWQRR